MANEVLDVTQSEWHYPWLYFSKTLEIQQTFLLKNRYYENFCCMVCQSKSRLISSFLGITSSSELQNRPHNSRRARYNELTSTICVLIKVTIWTWWFPRKITISALAEYEMKVVESLQEWLLWNRYDKQNRNASKPIKK